MAKNTLLGRKVLLKIALGIGAVLPIQAHACMDHYFYMQGNNATRYNSNALARLSVKEKIFKVKHAATAVAIIDKDANIEVSYELPPVSKNVSLQFTANGNVELLDQDIPLNDLKGKVSARFRVKQKGINSIGVTVSGEYEGEVLSYSSRVFISAKPAASS